MATFVLPTTLTPEGMRTVKNNPPRMHEVTREVEQLGVPCASTARSSASSTSARWPGLAGARLHEHRSLSLARRDSDRRAHRQPVAQSRPGEHTPRT
jgi:hypothetical protein